MHIPAGPSPQAPELSPFFPLLHGAPYVDDRRVISGIIYVIEHGLPWKDVPQAYGPRETPYSRFVRWSLLGVFGRIFMALAAEGGRPERIMIDATHLKAHRAALPGDNGYDSNWFRQAPAGQGTMPCMLSTKTRKQALDYDKTIYRRRHKIENMFATRYDRCVHTFFSVFRIAAVAAFFLEKWVLNPD